MGGVCWGQNHDDDIGRTVARSATSSRRASAVGCWREQEPWRPSTDRSSSEQAYLNVRSGCVRDALATSTTASRSSPRSESGETAESAQRDSRPRETPPKLEKPVCALWAAPRRQHGRPVGAAPTGRSSDSRRRLRLRRRARLGSLIEPCHHVTTSLLHTTCVWWCVRSSRKPRPVRGLEPGQRAPTGVLILYQVLQRLHNTRR